jgi:hypothetical protein
MPVSPSIILARFWQGVPMVDSFVHANENFLNALGGLLLVALFYWFRFHTLKGTRSYTTFLLYYTGVLTFIVPFVLIYCLLLMSLSLPIAAIWITILIWLTPVLPETWRRFCHRIAQIPLYAHGLQDALATAAFESRPEDMSAVRRKLARLGYQIDDFSAAQSTAIQSRFLKIAAIMFHLDEWHLKKEPFMERNSDHYCELLSIFDLLSFKTIRSLKNAAAIYSGIMEESKVQPDDWRSLDSLAALDNSASRLQAAAQSAAGVMLEDLRKDMEFLVDSLLLFVARAALASEWNFAGRKRRLGRIGFTITQHAPNVGPTILTAGAITIAWSLIWFALGNQIELPGGNSIGIPRSITLPSLNLVLNLLLVYFFKRNYAFANEGVFGRYPIGFILSVGILTAVLMCPVRIYFDFSFQFSNNIVWENLALSLLPWITGVAIALLVQDSVWSHFKAEWTKRVMDGAALCAAMTLGMFLVWGIHELKEIPILKGLPFGRQLSFMVILGFVIGYFVIYRVREASSLRSSKTKVISSSVLVRAT